ncbi:hypothetical protein EBU95_03920 [bacterium]|nr:hypothetical protein [bacterium]
MAKITAEKIKQIILEEGLSVRERGRTIYTTCPKCQKADKLSILKANGYTICYRGSCEFKGPKPFIYWLMDTASISKQEAIERIYGAKDQEYSEKIELKLSLENENQVKQPEQNNLEKLEWPLQFTSDLEFPESFEAVNYLQQRGISVQIAKKYQVSYYKETRRIVFPIIQNGHCTGWQARTIDSLPGYLKVRNNTGFQRASSVMFIDNVKPNSFIIVAEGPIDAIKFDACGNSVATMGKMISDKQLELILSKNPQKVYLALDDDAAQEMRELQSILKVPVYKIDVPESCKIRCQLQNKKADFGECTFEECLEAFKNARKLDYYSTVLYLKD